jgi:hypothetical protein
VSRLDSHDETSQHMVACPGGTICPMGTMEMMEDSFTMEET